MKTILLDLDGTLLAGQCEILPKTKAVLHYLQKQGLARIVLVSGRTITFMQPLVEALGLAEYDGYLIGNNGATVYRCLTQEILVDKKIAYPLARQILKHLRAFDVLPVVHHDAYVYVQGQPKVINFRENQPMDVALHEAETTNRELMIAPDLYQTIDFPINKILASADYRYIALKHQAIIGEYYGHVTGPVAVEFTAENIDKGSGILALAKYLKISPMTMIAFGDEKNDIPMFLAAGTGVAMGNAVPELKEIASAVTTSNEAEGVAQYLIDYFELAEIAF